MSEIVFLLKMYSLRPKINVSTLVELCTKVSTKLRHLFWDEGVYVSEYFKSLKYVTKIEYVKLDTSYIVSTSFFDM